jgi:hypothetical protein
MRHMLAKGMLFPAVKVNYQTLQVRTQRVCTELRDLIGYSYKPAELPADFDGLRNVRQLPRGQSHDLHCMH